MANFKRTVLPQAKPACPAGEPIHEAAGGTGCFCRVTRDLIQAAIDPSTLGNFCYHAEGYMQCPVWRKDKEHTWAERTNQDLLREDGTLRVNDTPVKEYNEAQELNEEFLAEGGVRSR